MTNHSASPKRAQDPTPPCCAHIRVVYRTEDFRAEVPKTEHSPGGMTTLTRGWWECASECGMRFAPLPSDGTTTPPPTCRCGPGQSCNECDIMGEQFPMIESDGNALDRWLGGAGEPTPSEEARNLMTDSPAPTRRSLIAAIPTGRAETWSTHGIASCLLAFAEDHPFPNVSAAMRAAASHLRALPPSPAGEPAPIEANVGGAFEFAASHASLESECAGLRAENARLREPDESARELVRKLLDEAAELRVSLASFRAAPDTRDAERMRTAVALREFVVDTIEGGTVLVIRKWSDRARHELGRGATLGEALDSALQTVGANAARSESRDAGTDANAR